MRRNILLLIMGISLLSCDKSDLLYDTNQKHTIYFNKVENEPEVNMFSFSYYDIQDTIICIPVKYIGMPVNKIQQFGVQLVSDTIGVLPEEGKDYEILSFKFEPNTVETDLKIRLKRSEILKDTVYGISLLFKETELFTPKYKTFYKLQVSDGELPKPTWWTTYEGTDRNRFLGLYYPEKYRKILEYFNKTKEQFPDFYKYATEEYGKFIHEIPENAEPRVKAFYFYKYSSIWGKYIFQPVWDYFTSQENKIPGDDISLMESPVTLYK